MRTCGGLSLLALLASGCVARGQIAADSYCMVYLPVVQQKGDGSISATPGVKRRLLYNEQMFRNECAGK